MSYDAILNYEVAFVKRSCRKAEFLEAAQRAKRVPAPG